MFGPPTKHGKPSPRRKEFPYYKVYTYSDVKLCWVEARIAAFDTLEAAREYVGKYISPAPARIIIVNERGRDIVEDIGAQK